MPTWLACLRGETNTKKQTLCFITQLIMWWDFTTAFMGNGTETNRHRTGCRNVIPPLFTAHFTNNRSQKVRVIPQSNMLYVSSWAVCETVYRRMKNKKRNNIKRYRCISCCYHCAPPAGVNSDQRPFIIWCCQNIKLSFQPSIRTKHRGERGRAEGGMKKDADGGRGGRKKGKCLCHDWRQTNKEGGRQSDDSDRLLLTHLWET